MIKKRKYMLLVASVFISSWLWSQTPVPDPDTVSTPIQQGDPALRTLPPRLDYVESRKRIRAEEVPHAVRQSLQGDERYKGWEESKIYYDENKEEYVLEFDEADKTKTYRFNNEGKAILEE